MYTKLKVCSWNIQGLLNRELGNKLNFPEVLDVIKPNDIICITETHADEKQVIEVKDFKSFSVIRPKTRGAKRNSGGITVLIRNSICKGVTVEKSKVLPYDVVWLKLNKKYFMCNQDIFIAVAYMSPENSSYAMRQQSDTFDLLELEIARYMSKGEIILTGDLNARTSDKIDYLVNDDNLYTPTPNDYLPDKKMATRSSQDMNMNGYGRKLIDLCKQSGLRILNGRTFGDINGKFTCHEYGGSSVVDYCVTQSNYIDNIEYFKVGDWLGHISDHCNIFFGIKLNVCQQERSNIKITPLPNSYKWYKESDLRFRKCISEPSIRENINILVTQIQNERVSCDEAVNKINEIFTLVANKSLTKTKRKKTNSPRKQKWFDRNCHEFKCKVRELSKLLSDRPFDKQIGSSFFHNKKMYKKLKKHKI